MIRWHIVTIFCGIVVLLMLLFPPWVQYIGGLAVPLGYQFVLEMDEGEIDIKRLAVQLAPFVLLLIFAVRKDSERRNRYGG